MVEKELNFTTSKLNIDKYSSINISLDVARLDLLHDVVSGNKMFKLKYFIDEAKKTAAETIITFGGAYSNHLVATAYQCKLSGFKSVGIVCGIEPDIHSHTLKDCIRYGMKLIFLTKESYRKKEEKEFIEKLKTEFENFILIPEGGYHAMGAQGASLIMDQIKDENYTHICTAIGTATTLAGLLMNSDNDINIIGIPVIKNMTDIETRLRYLIPQKKYNQPLIFPDYHFGGYAKKDKTLIEFMNSFYSEFNISTDFVYTGKMMFGVFDLLKKGYFKKGSKILCLHTGGLQGNTSLPEGTLVF